MCFPYSYWQESKMESLNLVNIVVYHVGCTAFKVDGRLPYTVGQYITIAQYSGLLL